jgi:hypothetical protein
MAAECGEHLPQDLELISLKDNAMTPSLLQKVCGPIPVMCLVPSAGVEPWWVALTGRQPQ